MCLLVVDTIHPDTKVEREAGKFKEEAPIREAGQKQLYSNRTHLLDRRGVLKDTTYLQTLPTTFYWLLNFELTLEYSAGKSRHY